MIFSFNRCVLFFLFVAFLFATDNGIAQTVKLDYIGEIPVYRGKPGKDTIWLINMMNRFDWKVSFTRNGNNHIEYITTKPDTIDFDDVDTVNFATRFIIDPQLINQQTSLYYDLSGSLSVDLNGQNLFTSGGFVKDKSSALSKLKQDDYFNFIFRDTACHFNIIYVHHPKEKVFDLSLELASAKWLDKQKSKKDTDIYRSYALGFYYLAFGILFLVFFLFHREKTENVYFAMFCIFAALSFLWRNFHFDFAVDQQHNFLTVLSLESLTIFFAKVLKNKDKSKIPLIIILLVTLISFSPLIQYNYTEIGGANHKLPLILIAILSILFVYTSFTSVYYLVRGFGEKRWEARVIVFGCTIAFFMFMIVPILLVIIQVISRATNPHFSQYMSDVGLCIYPLSAAIVLGRRNGLNQKQLTNQIKSIEQLSEDNLKKEREKKKILEDQKMELEEKVNERTIEVLNQKKEIELKNKAITDNINYAQRIQSAILPDVKLIYKALEQSFILFKPKDVVSGDFYAFAEKNGHVLIIAGDCTGHGVSGAFMSMIASSLLNHIINDKGVEQPDIILNQLNKSVIETLRQGENESNDGMDISICSFDIARRNMQYAGANRPLWLFRKQEIQVVRPDKFPIGGLQMARDRSFTNYKMQLEPGDTIYIFTDGYADQFGGAFGKKMMTAKFKEILSSIQELDMHAQELFLIDHFDKWKGSNEQVDDVLVIGVRV